MSRFLSALVIALMFFASACGGGTPAPQFQFPDEFSEPPAADTVLAEDGLNLEDQGFSPETLEETLEETAAPDETCVPDCENKDCGGDGCGGSCGGCGDGEICLEKGGSAICVEQGGCQPGEKLCQGTKVLECDEDGVEYVVVKDCAALDQACIDGACTGCIPACEGKQCGDDGCGGQCGSCGPSTLCYQDHCIISCDNPQCSLSGWCIGSAGQLALCGGVIGFDYNLSGQPLALDVSVESLYGDAGVLISTVNSYSVAETNQYEVNSQSKGNSCASHDGGGWYWLDDLIIRFVVPADGGYVQGATHNVSLYIAETWPEGIRVDFYSPQNPPGVPGATPFHQAWTESTGTAFIQHIAPTAIGYVVVATESDENFTIDDLGFGPILPY